MTRDNIADATEELQKMSVMFTEDDKQEMRNRLKTKISMVCVCGLDLAVSCSQNNTRSGLCMLTLNSCRTYSLV